MLKLGPAISSESWNVIGSEGYTILNALGSSKVVTTHNSFFKSSCGGSGSYNLTTIVGSSVVSSDNLILLAIIKLLSPKFK